MFRTWFQKLSDISSLARTEAMLKEALTDAVHELGFDCYAYLNVQPVRSYAVSYYANEWQQRYLDCDYKDIDLSIQSSGPRGQEWRRSAGP